MFVYERAFLQNVRTHGIMQRGYYQQAQDAKVCGPFYFHNHAVRILMNGTNK
jgi:hypothetical protein